MQICLFRRGGAAKCLKIIKKVSFCTCTISKILECISWDFPRKSFFQGNSSLPFYCIFRLCHFDYVCVGLVFAVAEKSPPHQNFRQKVCFSVVTSAANLQKSLETLTLCVGEHRGCNYWSTYIFSIATLLIMFAIWNWLSKAFRKLAKKGKVWSSGRGRLHLRKLELQLLKKRFMIHVCKKWRRFLQCFHHFYTSLGKIT